jgi:hypothetical protein
MAKNGKPLSKSAVLEAVTKAHGDEIARVVGERRQGAEVAYFQAGDMASGLKCEVRLLEPLIDRVGMLCASGSVHLATSSDCSRRSYVGVWRSLRAHAGGAITNSVAILQLQGRPPSLRTMGSERSETRRRCRGTPGYGGSGSGGTSSSLR